MKRRNFLKGLLAFAFIPVVAVGARRKGMSELHQRPIEWESMEIAGNPEIEATEWRWEQIKVGVDSKGQYQKKNGVKTYNGEKLIDVRRDISRQRIQRAKRRFEELQTNVNGSNVEFTGSGNDKWKSA